MSRVRGRAMGQRPTKRRIRRLPLADRAENRRIADLVHQQLQGEREAIERIKRVERP